MSRNLATLQWERLRSATTATVEAIRHAPAGDATHEERQSTAVMGLLAGAAASTFSMWMTYRPGIITYAWIVLAGVGLGFLVRNCRGSFLAGVFIGGCGTVFMGRIGLFLAFMIGIVSADPVRAAGRIVRRESLLLKSEAGKQIAVMEQYSSVLDPKEFCRLNRSLTERIRETKDRQDKRRTQLEKWRLWDRAEWAHIECHALELSEKIPYKNAFRIACNLKAQSKKRLAELK